MYGAALFSGGRGRVIIPFPIKYGVMRPVASAAPRQNGTGAVGYYDRQLDSNGDIGYFCFHAMRSTVAVWARAGRGMTRPPRT